MYCVEKKVIEGIRGLNLKLKKYYKHGVEEEKSYWE